MFQNNLNTGFSYRVTVMIWFRVKQTRSHEQRIQGPNDWGFTRNETTCNVESQQSQNSRRVYVCSKSADGERIMIAPLESCMRLLEWQQMSMLRFASIRMGAAGWPICIEVRTLNVAGFSSVPGLSKDLLRFLDEPRRLHRRRHMCVGRKMKRDY